METVDRCKGWICPVPSDGPSPTSPENGGKYLAVNIGRNDFNYQVKDIANVVAGILPGTEISINLNAQPDKEFPGVDFSCSNNWHRAICLSRH